MGARSARMPVILSSESVHRHVCRVDFIGVDLVEEAGVDSGEAGVLTLGGVVASAQDDGYELGSGGEVDTGFADGLKLVIRARRVGCSSRCRAGISIWV